MFFLFTDETNTTANLDSGIKFFVYGGLIIPSEKIDTLHEGIEAIRKKYSFNPGESFKFDSRTRPQQIGIENFGKAKGEVIDLCIQLNCKFIVYVVLHEIARSNPLSDNILWGADHVISKFNKFLSEKNSRGIVMVDRLSNKSEYSYLAKKFTDGLIFPDEGKTTKLDRINLFGSTCNNASHLSSVMDIVLGSFRYCINSPQNIPLAESMMKKVTQLIWADVMPNGNLVALEKGLIFRPRPVIVIRYQKEYDDLLNHINSLLSEPSQT